MPNIPKLEIVNVPPWGGKKKIDTCCIRWLTLTRTTEPSDDALYLKLVRLQLAFSCFGSEGRYIGADGNESFGVSIEHYGCDQSIGCTHCHTHIHHMIPAKRRKEVNADVSREKCVLRMTSSGLMGQLHCQKKLSLLQPPFFVFFTL